jgi:putative membrane protein
VWGNLINASREWGVQIMHLVGPYSRMVQATGNSSVPDSTEEEKAELLHKQRRLVLRQIAFLNALRFQLRSKSWWKEVREVKEGQKIAAQEGDVDEGDTLLKAISPFLSDAEAQSYVGSLNVAVDLLNKQSIEIRDLWAGRWIDSFHHVELLRLIGESFTGLGASERLNSFPFPRQYATFSRVFIWLFSLMLPFMLIGEVNKNFPEGIWMVVPLYVIIAWVFTMMEVVGGSSENPFENAINDVPISALCRIVEIDLKKMLGEKDLPETPKPVNDILM